MTEPTAFSIERIAPSAESYLRRLPRHLQEAIAQAFDHLCNVSPFRHPNPTVIRPLKGKYKGQWALPHWGYSHHLHHRPGETHYSYRLY